MLKRTIYIGNPAYLKLKDKQLVVQEPETKAVKGSVPVEDMALLLLDHPQLSLTSALLDYLMQHKVAVVHCNQKHLPNGLMLPLDGHSELTERWRVQLAASVPLKKQLWKQTVHAKIENQKGLLCIYNRPYAAMDTYMAQLQSGDSSNMEGKAAVHYWKYLLDDFRRERFGNPPNNFFNYGYAILRAIVARALVSSGLLPAQGIYHRNKYNSYCLADDIMEPYRPYVDSLVLDWMEQTDDVLLTKEAKAFLLQIATQDVEIDGNTRPLMVAVSSSTASLYKCFAGERRTIMYPKYVY